MKAEDIMAKINTLSLTELYNFEELFSKRFSYAYQRECNPQICFSEGKYKVYWMTPQGLCEEGSSLADKYKERNTKLFAKIELLVDRFQEFLLGEEGIRRYIETIDDRRLVQIIANGGAMDMKTGEIIDPLTEEKI